ncbi:heterokaryon incompatibility protein-like protein, partial [Stipitochalara longipes BDJ]
VQCALEPRFLNQNPKFEALSYVWGVFEEKDFVAVDVSGQEIFVTPNLNSALQYIRKEKEDVCMWADAICINQKDEEEKAVQVQMMREIYKTAKTVTVFLGTGTVEGSFLIGEINRLGHEAIAAGMHSLNGKELMDLLNDKIDDSSSTAKRAALKLADQAERRFPWASYNDFTKYEYWKRVWVFQEFCIAAKCRIMLGHDETDFDTFAAAHLLLNMMTGRTLKRLSDNNVDLWIKVLEEDNKVKDEERAAGLDGWRQQIKVNQNLIQAISNSEGRRITPMIGARKRYQSNTGNRTLMHLLEQCYVLGSSSSNREASLQRDKIYGLLGLASDTEKLDIIPNYRNMHSSLETADILTDVTSRLLRLGYIDILAWCQWPKSIKHLPTWVPDFVAINEPCSQTKAEKIFSASGDSQLVWTELPEKRFSIRGTKIDEIRGLGNPWTPDVLVDPFSISTSDRLRMNSQLYGYLRSIFLFSDFAKSEYKGLVTITPDQWKEAAWRVPCGDQLWLDNTRKRANDTGFDAYSTLVTEMSFFQSIISHNLNPEQPNMIPEVSFDEQMAEYPRLSGSEERRRYRVALDRQHNRRPFISLQGYIGLVPTHAKEGDILVILFGAVQPFLLRKVEKQYELVGEAYVYGIMDGEFLKTTPPEEDFELV